MKISGIDVDDDVIIYRKETGACCGFTTTVCTYESLTVSEIAEKALTLSNEYGFTYVLEGDVLTATITETPTKKFAIEGPPVPPAEVILTFTKVDDSVVDGSAENCDVK